MSDESGTPTSATFSEDYVKSLREEAASWRTKFRELETASKTKDIELGLANRNIKAKAAWVEVKEGQSIDEALDAFASEYPHLLVSQADLDGPKPKPEPTVKKSIQTNFTPPKNKVSNVEVKDLNQMLASRALDELKNDPKAREQLRDWYRSSLRS